jgi:hypothetical protein
LEKAQAAFLPQMRMFFTAGSFRFNRDVGACLEHDLMAVPLT